MSRPANGQDTGRVALVAIAAVATGAVLVSLREIIAPLVLALFLAVVIDAVARGLGRILPAIPARARLPLAFLLTAVLLGGILYMAAANAGGFIAQLAQDRHRLNALFVRLAGRVGMAQPPHIHGLIGHFGVGRRLLQLAYGVQTLVFGAVLVLVYLIFLFISRAGLRRKAKAMFRSDSQRERAEAVVARITGGIERYLRVQTLTALVVAGASWILMAAVGLQNAPFWAFLIFLASYVPILGGAVGLILPPIFALLQFDGLWQAVVLAVGAEAIHLIIGNVVAPRLQGASLNLDPLVVVLSLAFWGLLWGPIGMFLSTPLTVAAIVVLDQFDGVRWIAVLMSGDGRPGSHQSAA